MPKITDELLNQIYEAALLPDLWPDVLARISALSGATAGGVLFAMNPSFSGWKSSPGHQLFSEYIEGGWAARNPRPARRALAIKHAGFLGDDQFFTRQEMDEDPFYQWARERGGGWSFGTLIKMPAGDDVIFTWERRFDLGPFSHSTLQSLDLLRPHLARAAFVAGRLALNQARAVTEALARLGLPAGVIDFSNRLIAANDLFQELIPEVLQDRAMRVMLTDRRANALLGQALSHLSGSFGLEAASSIPIAGTEKRPPSILHVVPTRRAAQDLFTASSCMLVLTPIHRSNVPGADIVQALFDLTPAEARVAVAIAEGQTPERFATHAGLSIRTVRVQLGAVFSKIGISRQADLVALLGMTLPR